MYRNTAVYLISIFLILCIVIIPVYSLNQMIERDILDIKRKSRDIIDGNSRGEEIIMLWEEKKVKWYFYIHHNIVDSVDMAINNFAYHARKNNKSGMLDQYTGLCVIFRNIKSHDEINLCNIL